MTTRLTPSIAAAVALSFAFSACDDVEMDAPQAVVEASPCERAVAHLESCLGVTDAEFELNCVTEDATLLLDTPCEVLQAATDSTNALKADGWGDDSSFACGMLNLGCPMEDRCAPRLSDFTLDELIMLSEPTSVSGPEDVQLRVAAIADIFAWEGDPRGLFATVYRLITDRAVESVHNGDYEHPEWAQNLITEFGRRYLGNLHGHLTGGPISGAWDKYYGLAQKCEVGRGRTLGVAIAVHLMVDLPYTLYSIGSHQDQREDFVLFGDILLEVLPDLIRDIQRDYDTNVTGLLNGFLLGQWVDGLTMPGTMNAFMYQGVRLKAWRDGQNLRRFPHWAVNAEIRAAWGMAEVTLATLDAAGLL